MTLDLISIPIRTIEVPTNRRPADLARCRDELAPSIAAVGLLHPIAVEPVEPDGDADRYRLVAGANRLRACQLLGHTTIPAFVGAFTPVTAELAQIAENAHRIELDPEERDRSIRRWIELQAQIEPDRTPAGRAALAQEWRRVTDQAAAGVPAARERAVALQKELERPTLVEEAAAVHGVAQRTARRAVARDRLGDAERARLTTAHVSATDQAELATVRDPVRRGRLIVLCSGGMPLAEAQQIEAEFTEDEFEGLVLCQQQESPLDRAQIRRLRDVEPDARRAILALLAAGMDLEKAATSVLGESFEAGDLTLSDADWVERYCSESPGWIHGDRALFLAAASSYRRARTARRHFARAIGWPDWQHAPWDPYLHRLARLFVVKHPREWLRCGGTSGAPCYRGQGPTEVCRRCHGAGFVL